MSGFEEIINYLLRRGSGQVKPKTLYQNEVYYYLPEISDFEKKEIEFHNKINQGEVEIHQLFTVRNQYYHDYFKKILFKLPKEAVILEIGIGSGYDLPPLLKRGYQVIASDISTKSIQFVKSQLDSQFQAYKNQLLYLVADGQNLPLLDNSVDAIFCVATFHHFQNPHRAMAEICRVTKPGGLIILAMEPSRFMMWLTKLFKKIKDLRIYKDKSIADEMHRGYSKFDLNSIINHQSSIIKIKRVWLLLGFLHYGLEAIYRLGKLKKRIKVPRFIEWILLIIDEILLKIPLINQLNWHWIVIIANRKS